MTHIDELLTQTKLVVQLLRLDNETGKLSEETTQAIQTLLRMTAQREAQERNAVPLAISIVCFASAVVATVFLQR